MQLKKSLLVILLLTVVISCKKTSVETDNLFKFKDFVSFTTTGRVSVLKPIEINLVKDVEGWTADQEVLDKAISISPKVSGKLYSKNAHHITFVPDHPLQSDTEYAVTVHLNKLYEKIPKEFKDYTFQFKTITPNFLVITNDLQSYSKAWQYISGQINLSDAIGLDDAKSLIEASQDKKDLEITWDSTTEYAKSFHFTIDSIQRKIDDSKIKVVWNGRSIKAKNKGENTIDIPGQNNFKIVTVKVEQSPEQYLSINFSDPLKKATKFRWFSHTSKRKKSKICRRW